MIQNCQKFCFNPHAVITFSLALSRLRSNLTAIVFFSNNEGTFHGVKFNLSMGSNLTSTDLRYVLHKFPVHDNWPRDN